MPGMLAGGLRDCLIIVDSRADGWAACEPAVCGLSRSADGQGGRGEKARRHKLWTYIFEGAKTRQHKRFVAKRHMERTEGLKLSV